MKENMKYLLYAAILIIFSTTSAVIEVQYLRGVQRLNDSNYYDYYFTCNAQGNMMQWEVNGVISNPFTGDSVSEVKKYASSNFSYIATLLSSKRVSVGQVFDSVLIISSQGMYDFEAVCRNESSSVMATNTNNTQDIVNESKIDTVFLQYLLTNNITMNDDSKQTSLFICGTDSSFMTWRINRSDFMDISFTEGDSFGVERAFLQNGDSTVKQQGIFIGREPFMLVTIMLVVDSSQLTVTCGYSENQVNLTIEQVSSTSESTLPSTMSVSTVPSTTSMETKLPETNTIARDTTTGIASNVTAAVVPTIFLIVLIIVCTIFIALFCWFKVHKRNQQHLETKNEIDAKAEETTEKIEEGDVQQKGENMVGKITYFSNEVLGHGSDGTMVFKGKFDKRPVAVKRLLLECIDFADREAELLQLSDKHANIVRYYYMEQDDRFKYIALELCQATLDDYVNDRSKFTGYKVNSVDLLEQAMKGLAYLHSISIVHRDIKPHNVLLSFPSSSGSVTAMISDFGHCRKLHNGKVSFISSKLTGTPGWAAPEVLDKSKRLVHILSKHVKAGQVS